MPRKYFGDAPMPYGNMGYLGSATVDNVIEPDDPLIPSIDYDYPTFIIDANGDLIATYATTNTDLVFTLSGANLVAIYSAQNPQLSIVDGDLIAEV